MCEFCKEGRRAEGGRSKCGFDICRPREETLKYLAWRRQQEKNADEEWKTVESRKRRFAKGRENWGSGKAEPGSKYMEYEFSPKGNLATFFFTKFPENWHKEHLRNMFMKYEKVADIFVANKRTKSGNRFGFVRFKDIKNVEALQRKLNTIQIGYEKIQINVAKYSRQEIPKQNRMPTFKTHRHADGNQSQVGVMPKNNFVDGRTFKEAMLGEKIMDPPPIKIHLQVVEGQKDKLNRSWIGEARSIETLRNIWKIMEEEGLSECKIQHVGGLRVICVWDSIDLAICRLEENKTKLDKWFRKLKMWEVRDESSDRLAWIDIEGIPLHAKSSDAYVKIANQFGEVLEADLYDEHSFVNHNAGVLLLTSIMDRISANVKAVVGEKEFSVKVIEESNRSFLISHPDSYSNNKSVDWEDDEQSFASENSILDGVGDGDFEFVRDTYDDRNSSPIIAPVCRMGNRKIPRNSISRDVSLKKRDVSLKSVEEIEESAEKEIIMPISVNIAEGGLDKDIRDINGGPVDEGEVLGRKEIPGPISKEVSKDGLDQPNYADKKHTGRKDKPMKLNFGTSISSELGLKSSSESLMEKLGLKILNRNEECVKRGEGDA